MFKEKDGKYTEGRLKVSPMFLSKACTSTHDSLLFAAPVEESKQRGNHAFVWIYKQCLSVSTELILLHCFFWFLGISSHNWDGECVQLLLTWLNLRTPTLSLSSKRSAKWNGVWGWLGAVILRLYQPQAFTARQLTSISNLYLKAEFKFIWVRI